VWAGLEEQLDHLSEKSTSFSLPAIDKWAKMLTDTRNAKSWSKVFADGDGLAEVLFSASEQLDDRGQYGGSLRRVYAEFLDRAGQLADLDLSGPASAYRSAGKRWLEAAAACRSLPAVAEASRLSRVRRDAVERGDIGDEAARQAAERIASVLDSADRLGRDEMAAVFSDLSEAIRAVADAEREALEMLRSAVGPGAAMAN
jgi:hypothetical protein